VSGADNPEVELTRQVYKGAALRVEAEQSNRQIGTSEDHCFLSPRAPMFAGVIAGLWADW
jgi:hypothetical protein